MNVGSDREPRVIAREHLTEVRQWLDNNRRLAYLVALLVFVLWWTGRLPELPAWWPVLIIAGAGAAGAGYAAAGKILELLPEESGYLMIAYADEEVHEVSPDTFARLTVDGTLYQWGQTRTPVYECVTYDPDALHATANWKESFPDSEVAAEETPADAMAHVEEYREQFEPELAEARHIKRSVRSIIRKLDKERGEAQDAIIDESLAPAMGDDSTVTEMIRDEIPEDLHPRAGLHAADDEPEGEDSTDAPDDGDETDAEAESPELGSSEMWDQISDVATDGGEP